MSNFSPMKSIDELIFKQCDEIKKTDVHQQLADLNSSIDEDSKPIIKLLASVVYFMIFFGILFYFFQSSYKARKEISIKENIKEQAKAYGSLYSTRSELFRKFQNSQIINTESDLEKMISSSFGIISKSKMSFEDSQVNELSSDLKKSISSLKFKDITSKNFSTLVNNLKNRNKIQFTSSSIQKNEETKLISGTLGLLVFSK